MIGISAVERTQSAKPDERAGLYRSMEGGCKAFISKLHIL